MSLSFSSNTSAPPLPDCRETYVVIGFLVGYSLLLPLFILLLSVGYRRWKNQRCNPSRTQSHTDVLTYNSVFFDLYGILGSCIYLAYIYTKQRLAFVFAIKIFSIIQNGPVLFHVLTCMERYLAVVYPVLYLSLKTRAGTRIRNIAIVFIWLLCFAMGTGLTANSELVYDWFSLCVGIVALILVTFCCFSVLSSLLRPKPGDVTRTGDQSKRRAFHILVVIMLALWMRFFADLITNLVKVLPLAFHIQCLVPFCGVLFKLPSSLVLPLLFMQRTGNLPGCRRRGGGA